MSKNSISEDPNNPANQVDPKWSSQMASIQQAVMLVVQSAINPRATVAEQPVKIETPLTPAQIERYEKAIGRDYTAPDKSLIHISGAHPKFSVGFESGPVAVVLHADSFRWEKNAAGEWVRKVISSRYCDGKEFLSTHKRVAESEKPEWKEFLASEEA